MAILRTFAALGFVTALTAIAAPAHAKPRRIQEVDRVMTLERWLLPDAIADRIEGSGVDCRSFANAGGAVHKLHVGFLRLKITQRFALRAGIGLAKMSALPLAPEQGGGAMSAGVTFALWQRERYSLDLDATALRARYHEQAMHDATVMLAFRSTR